MSVRVTRMSVFPAAAATHRKPESNITNFAR
jgi:hypothetical protein